MNRFRAGAYHLLISVAVGAVLFSLFWLVLYPAPLFVAVGGLEIFLMLLTIDIVLGPALTTIVFNPKKKSLKADLAIIALVQLAALAYGVYSLYIARPVYIAALGSRFEVIHAADVPDQNLQEANQSLPRFGPRWVGTERPEDSKLREKILFSSLAGIDRGHYPQTHVPIEKMRDELLKESEKLAALKKYNPGRENDIDKWLAERKLSADAFLFQPLKARTQDMAVILDAKTAEVLYVAPFKPWQ